MTSKNFIEEWVSTSLYIKAHTSGSTGIPKDILLLKSDMCVSADNTNRFFGLTGNSRLLCPLSIDYIAGKMMIVRALRLNAPIDVLEPSNRFDYDGTTDYDLVCVVPSQVDHLLEHPQWSAHLRNIIIGGAPLDSRRKQSLIKAGYESYETYGMTETCSHVALRRVGNAEFEAMPDVSFGIDSRGCLSINLPSYSIGNLTTNDMVRLTDTKHFVWLGRYDNVIISGGKKIHPEEIEHKIAVLLPQYAPYAYYIKGERDDKWGETPVLIVEASADEGIKMLKAVRQVISHDIAPTKVISVNRIEHTFNGKIKRR